MLLLENNANPNLQDVNLNSSLHLAVARGHTDVIRYLLDYGADVNLQSGVSETAIQLAWRKYPESREVYLDIVRLLASHIVKMEHCNLVDISSQGFFYKIKGLSMNQTR
ncbi:ankyrin repeat domain-containing protein [Candidatus Orientia mediorientalis]|nr:ankyrin repeat domain-containing protein [Candidatus Orientia mediorientalis]